MKLVEACPDILAAATALGGLVLVFLGNVTTSFDSYDREAKPVVRGRYRKRAWFAFGTFYLCLFSALTALAGEEFEMPTVGAMAGLLLVLALSLVAALGVLEAGEIG